MGKVILIILIGIIHQFIYAGIGIPEAPIDINIQTNPEIIQVGDIVHVIVKAKLDTTHKMYHPNLKYAITVDDAKIISHSVRLQMKSPNIIESKLNRDKESRSNNVFEIVSFSEDAILDSPDKIATYSFSIKFIKDTAFDIGVPLKIFPFDTIEDFGGYPIYVFDAPLLYHVSRKSENETKKLPLELTKSIIIEYDSPNLPKFTLGPDGKPTTPLKVNTPGSEGFENYLLENLNTMKVDMSGVYDINRMIKKIDHFEVMINSASSLELNGKITGAYIENDDVENPIGTVSFNGNVLTFTSSKLLGATGTISYTIDDEIKELPIKLVNNKTK